MLEEVNKCPLCESKNLKAIDSISKKRDEGWVYVSKILNSSKNDTLKVMDQMKTYECKECSSCFYSPWFNDMQTNKAFSNIISRHQGGWMNLHHGLVSKNLGTIQQLNKHIIESIDFDKKITSYAELSRPFNGLTLLSFILDNPSPYQRILKFHKSIIRKPDSRSRFTMKFNDILINFASTLTTFIFFIEAFIRNLKNKKSQHFKRLGIKNSQKYLLLESSMYGWGESDEGYGMPSNKIALKLFNKQPISLNDAISKKMSFDFIGVFNFFDHLSRPLQTLELLMRLSSNIILTIHKPDYAGKQHRIIINSNFNEFLERKYPNWSIEKIDTTKLNLSNEDLYNIFYIKKI